MRMRSLGATMVAAALVSLVTATAPSAATQQFTWFDQALTHKATAYAQPTTSQPSDWTSPVNYAGGRVYLRFEVTAKPSAKSLLVQICVWRSSYAEETCSPTKSFSAPGVHWFDMGSPNSWWKKNGTWSWASPFSPTRLMIKDPVTGKLMMSGSCGTSCYTGSDLSSHVPISIHASAVVVASGATLSPPGTWTGCPSTWSPACGSDTGTNHAPIVDAGPNATTAVGQPLALRGSATDDGLPNPPGALSTGWSLVSGPGSVSFGDQSSPATTATFASAGSYVLRLSANDGAATSSDTVTVQATAPAGGTGAVAFIAGTTGPPTGDRPIRDRLVALGHTVRIVDDDALTQTALAGADLIVIASSVTPSKLPTWLADLAVPILSSEAYGQARLRLGAAGADVTGQTRLDIVASSHPLAAGRSGRITVGTASASFGQATPPAGATVIARIPGQTAKAAIYGVEAGGALTSGVAPARRVAYYLGYDAPARMNDHGRALFDAAVAWLLPPAPPPPATEWWDDAWGYRLPVSTSAGAVARSNTVSETPVNFTTAFAQAGGSGPLDPGSIRVVEVDASGAVIDGDVPFQFDPAPSFDASTTATGNLLILLKGATPAGSSRSYHVYFDTPAAGIAPAVVAPLVTLAEVVDAGQASYRIATPAGDWYYHLQGGGFSSLVDPAGNDWLNYSTEPGSAGVYRGIPNAVYPAGHFHPGATTSVTSLVAAGPLRITFRSVTTDNLWESVWEIFPDRARMTMVRAAANYWFLYEGTPGGQIDATTDVVIRNSGVETALSETWTGDLANPEWVAFADTVRDRSLVLAHHHGATEVDSYYLMENNMTVFGFGRSGTSRYLTGGGRQFSVALTDVDSLAPIQTVASGLLEPVAGALGSGSARPVS